MGWLNLIMGNIQYNSIKTINIRYSKDRNNNPNKI